MNKKKHFIIGVISIVFLCSITFIFFEKTHGSQVSSENQHNEMIVNPINEYLSSVKVFQSISYETLYQNEKQAVGNFVYFGRKTCPYCRKFVSKLNKAAKEDQVVIHYFDTENTDKDIKKQQVRSKYKIKLVPSLIYIKKGGSFVQYTPEHDDLYNWISNNKGE